MDNTNQTLFCPGIPGAGKTVIVSMIVDSLLSKASQPQAGIAFFYFDTYIFHKQPIDTLLMFTLKQLTKGFSVIPNDVEYLYHENRAKGTLATIE
ncbi:uncharacterized protein GGS22DRAFT_37572 [Annulohypoxylon maeteangense]|uniref:uncharacterized protein n=1 Tax=Annulohypoxylon maeteangense TaxID=1927788 RepID=UPI00200827EB|nr:uncharacterized protein GGS22DRAFT_37572 [Annulohypoxylon maeteangense]KAI0883222.1 hypothetical protein GGS22DRAFT_37572 [Annulohypoxylon maeteangense]